MKLLFDQNLSPRLVHRLADIYPASSHTETIGLGKATDRQVWAYARQHSFTIVTKDADYSDISLMLGFPPKLIWIRRRNCSTWVIEALLPHNLHAIEALDQDPGRGIITLF